MKSGAEVSCLTAQHCCVSKKQVHAGLSQETMPSVQAWLETKLLVKQELYVPGNKDYKFAVQAHLLFQSGLKDLARFLFGAAPKCGCSGHMLSCTQANKSKTMISNVEPEAYEHSQRLLLLMLRDSASNTPMWSCSQACTCPALVSCVGVHKHHTPKVKALFMIFPSISVASSKLPAAICLPADNTPCLCFRVDRS